MENLSLSVATPSIRSGHIEMNIPCCGRRPGVHGAVVAARDWYAAALQGKFDRVTG